jgi:linoleoyl-CoA desaturase
VSFTQQLGFRREAIRRVTAYLQVNNQRTRDLPAMYVKSAICLGWWTLAYGLMLYSGLAGWNFAVSAALSMLFGLGAGAIAFNIMHDANHNGYSDRPRVNRLLGLSIELVGLSNFIWRQQHNVWHHTYTNIAGLDEGLEFGGFLRNSPRDLWRPIHRLQHLYAPLAYSLAGIGLIFGRNFEVYFTGKSGPTFHYPPMTRNDKIVFWASRLVNLLIYLVIPIAVFGVGGALVLFLIASIVTGHVIVTVLQMAHVMNDVDFPEPTGNPLHIENEWAIHEVQTTSNFAPNNWVVNWYVGGLNYQIEHHLFPHMCHLVYPKIAPIVKQTCEEFGLTYTSYPTFFEALRNHYASLREFGRKPIPA